MRRMKTFSGVVLVLVLALLPVSRTQSEDTLEEIPLEVKEIEAPLPLEISGVAAIPGGAYLVVGDETTKYGQIWPGGKKWKFPKEVEDAESVDVAIAPNGEELRLILGERNNTLTDQTGKTIYLDQQYKEICGRGLEGLAVRWNNDKWEVAVLWEGGFFVPKKCKNWRGEWSKPKVAIFYWVPSVGATDAHIEFQLEVNKQGKERFRAPDLVWDGDGLLVLLSSMNEDDNRWSHTWLQWFDLNGHPDPRRKPVKLEEVWRSYRTGEKGKNWEALDWTLDEQHLVMGYDAKKGKRVLAVFPWPLTNK